MLITSFMMVSFLLRSQSITDLDFLIGEWDIVETIYPGSDKEYQEMGTRTCSYYLDNRFIKCESSTTVSKNGKSRKYAYYINHDKKENCFRATNFAHDFPLHGQFVWYLDSANARIIAITPKNVVPDRFFRGTISFKDKNRLVWEGWSSKFQGDKEWEQIFEDVATKK